MTQVNKIGQIAQQVEIRPQLWLRKTEAQALEEILKLCTHKFQKKTSRQANSKKILVTIPSVVTLLIGCPASSCFVFEQDYTD